MQPLHAIIVKKLHMYSAPSELILNECCSQIACRSGVVVVHAQSHTLYELILWASQCPVRVDLEVQKVKGEMEIWFTHFKK